MNIKEIILGSFYIISIGEEKERKKTAIINLSSVLGINDIRVKFKKNKLSELSKKYNIIFYYIIDKINIYDDIYKRRIEIISRQLSEYKLFILNSLYGPPSTNNFKEYLNDKIIVSGHFIGDGYVEQKEDKKKKNNGCRDYMLHLNLTLAGYDSEFIFIDNFITDSDILFIPPEMKFEPLDYFNRKSEIYDSYYYDFNTYKNLKGGDEIIYVIGPPKFGMFIFAKNLAKHWGYHLINGKKINFKPESGKSYVIYNGDNFISKNSRIFLITDIILSEECEMMVSSHLTLFHKQLKKSSNYNISKVISYYDMKKKLPKDINIEIIHYIPYQIFKYKDNKLLYNYYDY